ncbi:MAG: hypothetical protein AAF959_19135 [Cyanobacteria bacterium P01_D01_bin.56]
MNADAQRCLNLILLSVAIEAAATNSNKSQVVIDILTAHFSPAPEDELGQLRRRLELVERRLAVIDPLKEK